MYICYKQISRTGYESICARLNHMNHTFTATRNTCPAMAVILQQFFPVFGDPQNRNILQQDDPKKHDPGFLNTVAGKILLPFFWKQNGNKKNKTG